MYNVTKKTEKISYNLVNVTLSANIYFLKLAKKMYKSHEIQILTHFTSDPKSLTVFYFRFSPRLSTLKINANILKQIKTFWHFNVHFASKIFKHILCRKIILWVPLECMWGIRKSHFTDLWRAMSLPDE